MRTPACLCLFLTVHTVRTGWARFSGGQDVAADKTDNVEVVRALDGSPIDNYEDIGNENMLTEETKAVPMYVNNYGKADHSGPGLLSQTLLEDRLPYEPSFGWVGKTDQRLAQGLPGFNFKDDFTPSPEEDQGPGDYGAEDDYGGGGGDARMGAGLGLVGLVGSKLGLVGSPGGHHGQGNRGQLRLGFQPDSQYRPPQDPYNEEPNRPSPYNQPSPYDQSPYDQSLRPGGPESYTDVRREPIETTGDFYDEPSEDYGAVGDYDPELDGGHVEYEELFNDQGNPLQGENPFHLSGPGAPPPLDKYGNEIHHNLPYDEGYNSPRDGSHGIRVVPFSDPQDFNDPRDHHSQGGIDFGPEDDFNPFHNDRNGPNHGQRHPLLGGDPHRSSGPTGPYNHDIWGSNGKPPTITFGF